jgi:hypothetical protein
MSVCRKGFKCPFPFRLTTCKIHKASALPAAASCAAQRVRADAFVVLFFSTFLLQHFFAVKKAGTLRVYSVFRSVFQHSVTIYSQMYHGFQTRALLSFLCRYATIQLLDELPLGEFCVRKEFSIMDHTYQRPLQLPAGYSVLSAEEMTYTEGGAFSINITPQQVMAFGINVTVNLLGLMGRYAFQGAVSGMQNALNDGLSVGDAIGHYWGKLNTWSKVATIGMAGLGGYYAYCQARSIYLSIKNLVDAFKNTYNEIQAKKKAEQEAAEQQNCLPTLVALC